MKFVYQQNIKRLITQTILTNDVVFIDLMIIICLFMYLVMLLIM